MPALLYSPAIMAIHNGDPFEHVTGAAYPMSNATKARDSLIQPNAEHHYSVTRADLPLSCPMPGMYLWNSHPKVFLPVENEGTSKCPYCGALFALVDK